MDKKQNTPYPPFVTLRPESGSESTHYFAMYEGLPEEYRLKAEKELNETEETCKRGIQALKEFTKKNKLDSLNNHLLLAVLRSCKFNLKKSEVKLKNFATHRRSIIQKIEKMDIAIAERLVSDLAFGILPYRDNHGRIIVYTQPACMHFENYDSELPIAVVLAVMLFLLNFEMTTVSGFVYYGECKSCTLYIAYKLAKISKSFIPVALSYPLRIAKIEVFNEFTLARWLINAACTLAPRKIRKRITFNGQGYDNLHKLYPPEILPEEFGGKRGPLNCNFYKDKFLDFIRELKAEAKQTDFIN